MTAISNRTALLLVNRRARMGGSSIEEARELLTGAGFAIIEPPNSDAPDIDSTIRTYAASIDSVIVGGGDGSLNSAAAAVRDHGLTLGILPLGTANDLARTLEIGPSIRVAAEIIARGNTRRIDLGRVNDHPFFNVASLGFSVELARNLTAAAKRRFGRLGYAVAGGRLLAQSRPFTISVEHDGRTEVLRTVQVSVGNGRFYGGGMTVESGARPDDGQLDFYSLGVENWWELVKLLPALRRGTHGRLPNVRAFSTRGEIVVRTRRPHDVNADGELVTRTPARFAIDRLAVEVFAP